MCSLITCAIVHFVQQDRFLTGILLISFNRVDLVHRTSFNDCLQRCDGIFVWVLLWSNATDQAESKENMGRFYWRWLCNCHFWRIILVPVVPISIFHLPN